MSERTETPPTFREILDKASKSAFRGGLAGGAAMGANVACLMWMRTTVRIPYDACLHDQCMHACIALGGGCIVGWTDCDARVFGVHFRSTYTIYDNVQTFVTYTFLFFVFCFFAHDNNDHNP